MTHMQPGAFECRKCWDVRYGLTGDCVNDAEDFRYAGHWKENGRTGQALACVPLN